MDFNILLGWGVAMEGCEICPLEFFATSMGVYNPIIESSNLVSTVHALFKSLAFCRIGFLGTNLWVNQCSLHMLPHTYCLWLGYIIYVFQF